MRPEATRSTAEPSPSRAAGVDEPVTTRENKTSRVAALDLLRLAGIVTVISTLHAVEYVNEASGSRVWMGNPAYVVLLSLTLGTVTAVAGHVLALAYPRIESGPALKRFVSRRLWRLWPLYVVALAVFSVVWFHPTSVLWVLVQLTGMGIAISGRVAPMTATLWYVQLLFVLSAGYALVMSRPTRVSRLVWLLVLSAAIVALWAFGVADERLVLFAPVFVFGAVAGRGAWLRSPKVVAGSAVVALAAAAGVAVFAETAPLGVLFPLRIALSLSAYAPLLAIATLVARRIPSGLLGAAAYGTYGAYLFHRPVLSVLARLLHPHAVLPSILLFCVVGPVAALGTGWSVQWSFDTVGRRLLSRRSAPPPVAHTSDASGRACLLLVHPRYAWHHRAYLAALAEAFELRVVQVFDDHAEDPMQPDLEAAMSRVCLGMAGVRVRHYGPRTLWRLWREVWSAGADADVILTTTQNPVHSKVAWIVSRLRRKPLLVVVQQWRDNARGGVARRVYDRLSVVVMRSAARVFPHGRKASEFCVRMGVAPDAIRIYPHVNADLSLLLDGPPSPPPRFRFLYVGRLVEVKGVEVLVRAFAEVSRSVDCELVVCGDGPLRERLEALAAESGADVTFRGWVAAPELPPIIASCDALVLPSRAIGDLYEGWGLVVGEAASLSKPVIVTDAVGCGPELVREAESGFIVPEGDADALAAAMSRLARDRDGARVLGRRSREVWESFCDPRVCVSLIREVVEAAGADG